MKLPDIAEVTTAEQATDIAIEWQHWSSDQTMYQSELIEYTEYFQALADKFGADLEEEFKENGII